MSSSSASATTCPSCSAPVSGKFCAACGSPVDGATCAGCRTALTPGARFCHRCGLAAGAPAPSAAGAAELRSATALPWAFAAIALLAFGAYVAAQRFGAVGDRPAAPPAMADASGGAPFAGGADPSQGLGRAPDISQLSPEERVDRLYNRIMTYYEAGKTDSVQMFAPMAVQAYQMLPQIDPLRRYDLGRIAEITGVLPLARAQSDTLLRENPRHLLGLILAARVAELEGREADRAQLTRRLVEAAPTELDASRVEYQLHRNDINIALAEAKRRGR
ncbi:MAG TPA: zinc ribbon domain-containing protein [Gemmatimonadaceae bacterium]|nr:zinc ribbon domain-containing protein [Gemmatimonadaceae bacterium]